MKKNGTINLAATNPASHGISNKIDVSFKIVVIDEFKVEGERLKG